MPGVLLIWIMVEKWFNMLAVSAGGVVRIFFLSPIISLFFLSLSLSLSLSLGWVDDLSCDLTSYSTEFQLYQDDGWVMEACA